MICISIAQESRRMALADMLNAARQGDLIEVRLDRFDKAPDLGELFSAKPKPLIMSCRRRQDGGEWNGTEEERLALLRQCIISKADYVEIELDAADQIRKFPPSKRVISYTNLHETPSDIAQIYAQAVTKSPDVVKLTTMARTPEEAWPLVQILAKPAVPTIVVGLGKEGTMLTLLAKKMGATWAYAALEKGMEAYPEQPTVTALREVYHYEAIEKGTRLIAVTGFDESQTALLAGLNAAFAHLKLNTRCLPLEIGNIRLFRKVLEAVKLTAAVIDAESRNSVLQIATELDPPAQHAQAADFLSHQGEKWHGYNLACRAAAAALNRVLTAKSSGAKGIEGRTVMFLGTNGVARALAHRVQKEGGIPIISSREKDAAHALAQELGCRHIAFDAVYATLHDVLCVCAEEQRHAAVKGKATEEKGIHPGYLKSSMTVMDLTAGTRTSDLLREAALRTCGIVTPQMILVEQATRVVKAVAGQEVPREILEAAMNPLLTEEE